MTPTEVAVMIAGAGFVVSLLGSVLAVGIAWGMMRGELHAVQKALQGSASSVELQSLAQRFGRIEGLFQYRLIDEPGIGRHSQTPP